MSHRSQAPFRSSAILIAAASTIAALFALFAAIGVQRSVPDGPQCAGSITHRDLALLVERF